MSNSIRIDNVLMVFQIEWNVIRTASNEDHFLPYSMGIPHLVKYVCIATGHIGNEQVGSLNLVIDAAHNILIEQLLVYSFTPKARLQTGRLNAEQIDITKFVCKRHKHKG